MESPPPRVGRRVGRPLRGARREARGAGEAACGAASVARAAAAMPVALAVADRISKDKAASLAASIREELTHDDERREMERVAARAAQIMLGSVAARREGALVRFGERRKQLVLPPQQALLDGVCLRWLSARAVDRYHRLAVVVLLIRSLP